MALPQSNIENTHHRQYIDGELLLVLSKTQEHQGNITAKTLIELDFDRNNPGSTSIPIDI
jgi:hypothetical protein